MPLPKVLMFETLTTTSVLLSSLARGMFSFFYCGKNGKNGKNAKMIVVTCPNCDLL